MSIKLKVPLNIKNKNGRIYTTEEFEKHIDEYMSKEFRFGTFLISMKDDDIPIEYISHSIDNLYIKNTNLIVEITILDTPYGKILNQLYENDIYFSVSPCSYGMANPDDYVEISSIITFAIVTIENDAFFIGNKLREYKLKKLKEYEST